MDKFANRYAAGKLLAAYLELFANDPDCIILALPRGGVPVAYEIAKTLSLPLEVFIVRKLGVPGHEEFAMGAIASGDVIVFNQDVIRELGIEPSSIEQVIQAEKQELRRREFVYRGNRIFPECAHKTVILVDDGVATGATMRAAIKAVQAKNPKRMVVAIPVAALSTYKELAKLVDQVICPFRPEFFNAVGNWYEDFSQTTDEEVFSLLAKLNK